MREGREDGADRNLLNILGAKARPTGLHFRANPRHETTATGRLEWGSRSSRRAIRLRLKDINRWGAGGFIEESAPLGVPVRLRLIWPEATPWIEAVVLAIEPLDGSRKRIRVRFLEPCPNLFLKAAILGGVAVGPSTSDEARKTSS